MEEHENLNPVPDGEGNDTNAENLLNEGGDEGSTEEARSRRKPRIPKHYTGARKDLYPTCTLMWKSCEENLPQFTLFSESYDADLIKNRQELIVSVRALPDEMERTEPHRTAYDAAVVACTDYCAGWQRLKRYIERAKYPLEAAKLDLAGQKLYAPASRFEWSNAEALIAAADKFTASHLDSLTANRNMPATFPAELTALGTKLTEKITAFRNFEIATEELTDQKMIAENDLYDKTVEMGKDGQEIFKKDPAKARLFTYAAMLEAVSGVGSASLVGTVTEEGTNQPVGNVTVTIQGRNLSGTTSAAGKYSIKQVASGTLTVNLSAPGFVAQTITGVAVDPGIAKRLNVKLRRV